MVSIPNIEFKTELSILDYYNYVSDLSNLKIKRKSTVPIPEAAEHLKLGDSKDVLYVSKKYKPFIIDREESVRNGYKKSKHFDLQAYLDFREKNNNIVQQCTLLLAYVDYTYYKNRGTRSILDVIKEDGLFSYQMIQEHSITPPRAMAIIKQIQIKKPNWIQSFNNYYA